VPGDTSLVAHLSQKEKKQRGGEVYKEEACHLFKGGVKKKIVRSHMESGGGQSRGGE